MAVDEFLLSILVCPETKTKVALAKDSLVQEINAQIQLGSLRNLAGQVVTEKLDGALIRVDGKRLYPVRGDIPIMLVDEAIAL